MAQIVVMPALGNTVESCLLTTWLVSVGDVVDAAATLCEIETDKAAMDVPAGVAGTVLALLAAQGDEVPVKAPIAVIGAPDDNAEEALAEAGLAPQVTGEAGEVDESAPDDLAPSASQTSPDAQPAPDAPAAGTAPTSSGGAVASSPRARGFAERAGLDWTQAAGTGPHGRVIERDVAALAASGPQPTAATRGADLTGVGQGTALGGRVGAADLAGVGAEPAPAPAAPSHSGGVPHEFPGAFTDTPLKGVRKIVAERMMNALATSAQLTYTVTAPADGLLALRTRFKASDPARGFTGITLGDLVCFATVRVLARHANLNAHLADGTLRTFESVHLGLAVDTPRGLLVPTIRHADTLSLRELSQATKDLAAQCHDGKIDPALLTGATFTVSNLGAFGMESFTPIINVPQTGILGVNTILPRAVALADGSVGLEQRLGLSLTADHQVVDGADAARFLADLSAAIADIDLTVMG